MIFTLFSILCIPTISLLLIQENKNLRLFASLPVSLSVSLPGFGGYNLFIVLYCIVLHCIVLYSVRHYNLIFRGSTLDLICPSKLD